METLNFTRAVEYVRLCMDGFFPDADITVIAKKLNDNNQIVISHSGIVPETLIREIRADLWCFDCIIVNNNLHYVRPPLVSRFLQKKYTDLMFKYEKKQPINDRRLYFATVHWDRINHLLADGYYDEELRDEYI